MIVRGLYIEAQITGSIKTIPTPRVQLCPSDPIIPFKLCRRQFAIKITFAMTVTNAQGQMLSRVENFQLSLISFPSSSLWGIFPSLFISQCRDRKYTQNDWQYQTLYLEKRFKPYLFIYLFIYQVVQRFYIFLRPFDNYIIFFFHLSLSFQSSSINPFSSIRPLISSAQVSLGLPRFLLPGGLYFITFFGSLPSSIRWTCPYHLSCLVLISSKRDLVTFHFLFNNIIPNFVLPGNSSRASPKVHFCGIQFCYRCLKPSHT